MARRTLIWHLGLADLPRDVVGTNLQAHRDLLAEAGARVVATEHEAREATREVLGERRDGTWARIADRVWKHRGVSLLSTPDVCAADKDQLRFALDQLVDIEVHLVLTVDTPSAQLYGGWLAELRAGRGTGWEKYVGRVLAEPPVHRQAEAFRAGHDVERVLARWGWTVRPERLHVLAATDLAAQWEAFLAVAGLDVRPDPVLPAWADPAGVAVLRRVNRHAESPVAGRRLLAGRDDERGAMPVLATPSLVPVLERWDRTLREAGYDVRGSLADLAEPGAEVALPGARDQLGVAVEALADALGEVAELRGRVEVLTAERDRLDRKRRKHKRALERLRET